MEPERAPGLQMPSPSKPNRSEPGTASGSSDTGEDELLSTPISESSDASYGPWLGSCRTVSVLLLTSIRNWQPVSSSTAGHSVN